MSQKPEESPAKKCLGAHFNVGGYSYKIVANAPAESVPAENAEVTPPKEEEGAVGGVEAATAADDNTNNNKPDEEQVADPEDASGETVGGDGTVIRRMNPRGGQLLRSKAQEGDSVDQAENRLPPVDTMEACNKAAERLRELANHLQHGEVPINVLQKALQYAACVLDTVCVDETTSAEQASTELKESNPSKLCSTFLSFINNLPRQFSFNSKRSKSDDKSATPPAASQSPERPPLRRRQFTRLMSKNRRTIDDEDELSEFNPNAVPTEVREWLAATFSNKTAAPKKRSEDKPKFRSVANAIRAGIMVDRLYRRMSNSTLFYIPTHISLYLKGLDDYSFDVFSLNEKANGQGLRYLAYDLLNRYGLTHKFKIASSTMENFMTQVLHGYVRHKNPYHNDLHAADVTQTVHYMLCQGGLANWLTDLEIFAAIIAAIIHDFEHTGTTNNFHVMSRSDTALLYNDRAVLENHHVSTAFRLLREDDCNILSHLSKEEYKEFRSLVIDMVLATDMSSHFQQLKSVKSLIGHNDLSGSQKGANAPSGKKSAKSKKSLDKSKALSLMLHCCDISHPSKSWDLHHKWTMLLMEEFFLQGDKEQELGLPYSPLCDRNTTLIAESQIGFIDFIVSPSLEVCGDMMEKIEANNKNARSPPIAETVNEEAPPADDSAASGALANSIKTDNAPEAEAPSTTPNAAEAPVTDSACLAVSACAVASASAAAAPTVNASATDSTSSASSAPSSPKITPQPKGKVKRPWVHHLEDNKMKWKARTSKNAELRAQLSVVQNDANGDKPEPPDRVIV